MTQRFDSIVVGAGQAGPALAVRLAKAGKRTAIIERQLFGGTCVNTGCIPTKTLIASARVAHVSRRAHEFGIRIEGGVGIDMPRVKARKDAVVLHYSRGVERWLRGTANLTVIEGHARFEGPRTLRVGEMLLEADQVFLNVGARARIPEMSGLDTIDYLTNTTMMDLDIVPRHLVVIGGSYIGLEFAQMYRRFGAEVTVVEMGSKLISREDPEVSDAVREILEGEGIDVRLGAQCIRFAKVAAGVEVGLDCGPQSQSVSGSHVLLAVGRTPNTGDLGLEQGGIAVDKQGFIVVDEELRTNQPGIWALGDVNGRGAFTHTSWNDYEIVAANLLDGEQRRTRDRIPAYALYIDPPLGRAGMSEREVRASGRDALVASMPMAAVGRANERSETQGLMKILVDPVTEKILGAAILGIEGDEVIHAVLEVMYADASYKRLQRAMHIHPTVSEFLPTLLEKLAPLRAGDPAA